MATSLDMNEVKGSFPALSGEQVIRDYLLNTNVQLGATYATSKTSTNRYADGYAAAAKYINASIDEIVLGSSTTQLLRNASHALNFQEGDEIIVSALDHEANIAPWVDLAARQNLVLKWWKPNILGTIHDIPAISATIRAHSPSTLFCVDAVAYAPHRPIDVRALGVDLYAFSWYKVYGPHISLLYASSRANAAMRSLGHFFNQHATLEEKLGLAGSAYELVHGIPAVVEYLEGMDEVKGLIKVLEKVLDERK
ncbi:hypothetical protein N0V88_006658 [Collariella sp. IMI 366227]|nr:hypothetical protein N0V88_006658 [Collariella sp. IMI 366227]